MIRHLQYKADLQEGPISWCNLPAFILTNSMYQKNRCASTILLTHYYLC